MANKSEEQKVNREQDVLKALLSVGSEKPKRFVKMKRFGVEFELKAIDGKTVNRIREQATFTDKKNRKTLDDDLFNALIVEQGTVTPNWNDPQIIKQYGTSDQAILTLLLAGEMARLSTEILELSGFGEDDEEDENSIKN